MVSARGGIEREREGGRGYGFFPGGKGEKGSRTIVVIIADDHLLRLAVLAHLAPKVLVKGVKVVLQLARVHLVLGVVGRVLVQVGQEDGLRVGGFDVLAAAAVAVPAGADFVVEGAVDLVLLRAEDGGEVAGGEEGAISWGVGGWRRKRGRDGLTWPWLLCGQR